MSLSAALILLALVFLVLSTFTKVPLWTAVLWLLIERLLTLRGLPVVLAILLMPTTVNAQSINWQTVADITNGAALVAHAADYGTTVRCTTAGTCSEGNKIVAPFVHGDSPSQAKYFAAKWGTAFGSFLVKNWLKKEHPVWAVVAGAAETTAFAFIAKHNYDVHRKATP